MSGASGASASYNFLEGLSVRSGWKFEAITGL